MTPAVRGDAGGCNGARLRVRRAVRRLVVADLFGANGRYTADWPTLAGVGAGAIALRFGRSPVVVFLLAIATTALARLVS